VEFLPDSGHAVTHRIRRNHEQTTAPEPQARGFVYLAVALDWFSRRVLSWRVSITMEAAFCVETLEEALAKHGKPEIFNTDQGSQFTGAAFTGLLIKNGIAISMDGKGAWRDNVFVERLWRSVKYEEVYLRAYDSVAEARTSIGRYLDFYNGRRPHSSLDRRTPDQAYFTPLPIRMAATTADAPLIDAEKLFRQPRPPHGVSKDVSTTSRGTFFWVPPSGRVLARPATRKSKSGHSPPG
jgi:Integrase core domain